MNEASGLRQWLAIAVEHKAGDREVIAGLARQQRRTAREHKARGAANAKDLYAVRKLKIARAVDAWHQDQWCARARGLIDCTLQSTALIVWSAGPNAELRRVYPIGRKWHAQCGGA